ncbi:MAG: RDD family protein [Gammaproteobacteria bacterium]|nr:RDD family protein [Gammaproteobacteria bacterium]MYF38531.1 RDD family protein [Gammaproteobacteria bacterium]
MSKAYNPYQAPKAGLTEVKPDVPVELASIVQRVLARVIDNLILSFVAFVIILFVAMIALILMLVFGGIDEDSFAELETWSGLIEQYQNPFDFKFFNLFILGSIIVNQGLFLAIQGVFLHRYGQTIGKRLLKIAMVDAETHEKVPLPQLFVLRYLIWDIPAFVYSPVNWIIRVVDLCFALRKNRRTLHDMTANTIVIKV